MPKINILDDFTINQIAAGEVIERPSSIIKELVENAIDAGSSAVTVEIKDGGIPFIRVTDNGVGMDEEDARLCFQRHATSKIKSSDDLYDISSLGFRGEALASIAAVSQVEMFTRPHNAIGGTHIINHGGNVISVREAGCPEGTTVIVRNLFYNAPARLKFLKSPKTETAHISELVGRLILAHPEVSVRYINNDKAVYHSPGNGSLLSAVISVYGKDVKGQILEIDKIDNKKGISLYGYIGRPSLARTNRSHQSFFVNGRYIKSQLLSRSLEDAHRSYLPIHHFPWAVLHITIPADQIDVNVHPAKTEIRFKEEQEVYSLLLQWLKEALEEHPYIPHIQQNSLKDIGHPGVDYQTVGNDVVGDTGIKEDDTRHDSHQIEGYNTESAMHLKQRQMSFISIPASETKHAYMTGTCSDSQHKKNTSDGMVQDFHEHNIDSFKLYPFKIIGRVFSTYAIAEGEDQIFFMDQHAAHERLIYEELNNSLAERSIASQQLLPPVILEFTHDEYLMVEEARDTFESLGFELEPFGGNTWAVRGIPVVLKDISVHKLFHDVLDQWKGEHKTHLSIVFKPQDIMKIACKQAVKARDPLSDTELMFLLQSFQSKNIPLTCPHGRPIIVTITKYQLEKKFKRIQ